MADSSGTVGRRWGARSGWMGALLLAIVSVYAFVGSAGRLDRPWPIITEDYDLLAEGFRAGHLYSFQSPSAELLAQDNPYNSSHIDLWILDLSLHGGEYYLYWGPLPAALQAMVKEALGIYRVIGDAYLTFSFFAICAFFGALLIERLARRLFPAIPVSFIVTAMITFAFSNPVLHITASGGVYQAAIVGGQAFLLGGLLFAFDAVWKGQDRDALSATNRRLATAGAFWALALACRVSLAPLVACIASATILAAAWPIARRWKSGLQGAVCLGVPLVAGFAMLLIYNKLRFDKWLEFGINIQLSGFPYRVSIRNVAVNLYAVLLRDVDWSCRFPYLLQVWDMGARALPDWLQKPPGYVITEPVVGFLRAVPITWFGPIAVVAAVVTIRDLLKRRSDQAAETRRQCAYLWCAMSFAFYGTISSATFLGLYVATMRFLADISFGLVLLGILGAFTLYTLLQTRAERRIAAAVYFTISAATIVIGLLLGYQGYGWHFQNNNPELDAKLAGVLSFCDYLN